MLKPMPYPEIYPPDEEGYHPIGAGRNMFVDHVDEGVAGLILERLRLSTASFAVAQLRVLGGAMARVPVEATAFAHRKSPIMLHVASLYEKPEEKSAARGLGRGFSRRPAPGEQGRLRQLRGGRRTCSASARHTPRQPGSAWSISSASTIRPTSSSFNQNIPPA